MKPLGLLDDLKTHSARNIFGTKMAAAGAQPENIQQILRHSDYSMTANTYVTQDVTTLKTGVELLA